MLETSKTPEQRAIHAVGIVAIGRNEGDRLRPCLRSIRHASDRVVYVDSGSVDDSVELAHSFGVEVVELDPSRPFTAARGRNAGLDRVLALWPDTRFIQFVDGDCELDPSWIGAALATFVSAPDVAVVCGRRRERYPERTVFNWLCDIEWSGAAGLVDTCGGDALMRVQPLLAVNGYTEELIAGEDDDVCYRIRRQGWQILRLDDEMTLHDIAMTTIQQWWQRNRRSGHAGAESWRRRGHDDPRLAKIIVSNLLWGLPPFWLFWPFLWWRVYRRSGALYATHIVLGKVPHCVGQLSFLWRSARGRKMALIEYK